MVWECHRFESRHQARPASAGELAPVEAPSWVHWWAQVSPFE